MVSSEFITTIMKQNSRFTDPSLSGESSLVMAITATVIQESGISPEPGLEEENKVHGRHQQS